MPKLLYVYHGGSKPQSPEEGEKIMAKWYAWFEKLGAAVADGGNPVGLSKTVTGETVADNGGANPASGYSIINASDINDATDKAKGCPIHDNGGSVEVAEIIEM